MVQADQRAMANLQSRAARAREMTAYHSLPVHQVSCLLAVVVCKTITLMIASACRLIPLVPLLTETLPTYHLAWHLAGIAQMSNLTQRE